MDMEALSVKIESIKLATLLLWIGSESISIHTMVIVMASAVLMFSMVVVRVLVTAIHVRLVVCLSVLIIVVNF